MESEAAILTVIPYLLSLLLSLSILLYAWRHRRVRGATAFMWYVGGQSLYILGFILEMTSPSLQSKIAWDKLQWLAETMVVIVAYFVFAVDFTETKFSHPRLAWTLIYFFPAVFTLILATDGYHHLIYPDPHLVPRGPFDELTYTFTSVVYLYALYIYLVPFYGIGLLVRRAFRLHGLARLQMIGLSLGFAIPVLSSIPSLFGIEIFGQRDIGPLSFGLGNLLIAIALFRHRLFDLVPVARDTIFENISDPVIVFDLQGRVVDLNPAALASLGMEASAVIGQPGSKVYAAWPDLVERFSRVAETNTQISVQVRGEPHHYEITISPLYDRRGVMAGRVFITRDITEHKQLEEALRLLNRQLEDRVDERTEALHESAEQYRAVVENLSEFIVRWRPDGKRTFVNKAYLDYFGISLEQALSDSFMPLIVEEDRAAIEEKIARLNSGQVRSEADTHRVIRPDGSIGWQEWTDLAILDGAGQIVEFQSVGRDITERILAEKALAEAYDTTLAGWAKALEFRDKETEGHSRRVTEMTVALGRALNLSEDELVNIRRGALLHDIGKMAIPDEILRKDGQLTDEEKQVIAQHPLIAYQLLSPIPYLEKALEIPYCHHEHYDGMGYPRGLKGKAIPLSARIFAIVDVWDALNSDRPYRKAWPKKKILAHMQAEAGAYFDPDVLQVFLDLCAQGKI